MDKETQNIFILGLFVLFGWAFVVIFCASPQLFREFICRYCCCCCKNRHASNEKIRNAQERMNFARRSFLATTLAGQKDLPTAILLHQAMGPSTSRGLVSEAIPEESRCTSMQPEHDSSDSSLHASISDIKNTP